MAFGINKRPDHIEYRDPSYGIAITSTEDKQVRVTIGPIGDAENTRWIVLNPDWAFQIALWILEARDGERPE